MATLAHHWDCMDFHEEEVSSFFDNLLSNYISVTGFMSVMRYRPNSAIPAIFLKAKRALFESVYVKNRTHRTMFPI